MFPKEYIKEGKEKARQILKDWCASLPDFHIAQELLIANNPRDCSKSWDLVEGNITEQEKTWNLKDNYEAMEYIFGSKFERLLLWQARGDGRGFWEVIDDIPEMNTIV